MRYYLKAVLIVSLGNMNIYTTHHNDDWMFLFYFRESDPDTTRGKTKPKYVQHK